MNSNSIDCRISDTALVTAQLREELPALKECGGFVAFEGVVRNINHGKAVTHLEYEAYEELAIKELASICREAIEAKGVKFIQCVHRVGRLEIGDPAVIIQVLSGHRKEAFEACEYVIDQLKVRVPIWKNEFYEDQTNNWTRCSHSH